MDLIRLLAEPEDNDKLPPPPPLLRGADFSIDDLLLELKYQREKSRRREAAYLSVVCHCLLLLLLLSLPKWMDWLHLTPIAPMHRIMPDQDWFNPKNMTYLEMPKDLVTRQPPKNPHVMSDQDRHFERQDKVTDSISTPVPQPKPSPAPPNSPAPPAPAPQPASPPATSQPSAPAVNDATQTAPQPQPKSADNGLKLEDIPRPNPVNHTPFGTLSATQNIQHALDAVAANHGSAGQQYNEVAPLPRRSGAPAGTGARGQEGTSTTILTDTQGVDFSSYMQRIIETVRENWYAVMPETVWLGTKGRDVIIFNINANGTLDSLQLVSPSGTVSLDQAALASINASNPFPPLPTQFHGPFIKLQFGFFYNLTPGDQ